jgi:hypothetical protein
MRWIGRIGVLVASAVAAVALAATAGAAVSSTWNVSGIEIGHVGTTSTFVGFASAVDGGRGLWKATATYDTLAADGHVTGGSLQMGLRGADGTIAQGSATIANGTITIVSQPAGCGDEVFGIAGDLANVQLGTTTGGTGSYAVKLTHKRAMFGGRCITYAGLVTGSLTLNTGAGAST